MPVEKKSKTAKKPTPAPAGWRASSVPPQWDAELAAARHRRDDWSLSKILTAPVKGAFNNFMAVTQQPLDNIANLLPGRIVDPRATLMGNAKDIFRPNPAPANRPTAKTTPEMLKGTAAEPFFEGAGEFIRSAMDRRQPGDTKFPKTPPQKVPAGNWEISGAKQFTGPRLPVVPGIDPNVFGAQGVLIAAAAQRRREAEEKRRKEIQEKADALVAGEVDQRPLFERGIAAMENVPVLGPMAGALWDSRAGLASSAVDAGFSPEAGMAMSVANPLNVSPADLSTVPLQVAARKLAGKSALGPLRYEGALPVGRRPFQAHQPIKYQTPMAQLEESAARRNAALSQQEFNSRWNELEAADRAAEADVAAEKAAFPPSQLNEKLDAQAALIREKERNMALQAQQDAEANLAARNARVQQIRAEGYRGKVLQAPAELKAKAAVGWRAAQQTPDAIPDAPPMPPVASAAEPVGGNVGWRASAHAPGPMKPPEPSMPGAEDFIARPMAPADAPPSVGWRAALPPQGAMPTEAPRMPPQPLAAPDAPIAPPRPPEPTSGFQNASQEVPAAPPQLPPPPRAQEVPSQPTAPQYEPVEVEGMRGEPAAPALGGGDAAAVGPSIAPPTSHRPGSPSSWEADPRDAMLPPPKKPRGRFRQAQTFIGDQLSNSPDDSYVAFVNGMADETGYSLSEVRHMVDAELALRAKQPNLPEKVAAMPPDARAKIWQSLSKEEQRAVNEILTKDTKSRFSDTFSRRKLLAGAAIAGGAAGLGAALPEGSEEGGAWPQVAKDALGVAATVGAYLVADQAFSSKAARALSTKFGDKVLPLVDAAKGNASNAIKATVGVMPGEAKIANAAKAVVDRYFSKRMLTDNVVGADDLAELLDMLRDLEAASARRANDLTTPLRTAPLDERQVANAALQDPGIRSDPALRSGRPELAKTIDEVRDALDMATQRKLAAQYQVSESMWLALSDAQKRELGRFLQMPNEVSGSALKGATPPPAGSFEAFKVATLEKMKASGALRKDADGNWKLVAPHLDIDTALDNIGKHLARKYAAHEGGKEAFSVFDAIDANTAKYGPGGTTPDPSRLLTPDERRYLQENLMPRIESARNSRDVNAIQHLLERENVSPRLREVLGELTEDPGYRAALTLHNLERDVARHQAFEAMGLNPNYTVPISDDPDIIRKTVQQWGVKEAWHVPNEPSLYGEIAGRHVHPEFGDLLRLHFGEPGNPNALRDLTNWWKANVVVLNPDSHGRQFIQNWGQADLAGPGAVGHAANLRAVLPELRARSGPLYEEARAAGLFSGTYYDAELTKELHEAILEIPKDATSMEFLARTMGTMGAIAKASVGSLPKSAVKKAGTIFEFGDEWHRLALFKDGLEQGMTAREAVKYVRSSLYDASRMSRFERLVTGRGVSNTLRESTKVSRGLDLLSSVVKAPFGMAFISNARIGARSLLGMRPGRMVPFSDPAMALRASKYWALPLMLKQFWNEGDDESRPSYEKPILDNVLPLSMKLPDSVSRFLGSDGKPNFFSYKALLPWGEIAGTVYDSMQGDFSMARALPGLGADPMLQMLTAVASNENPFTKRQLWNQNMGAGEIAANAAGYLTQAALPRWTPGVVGAIPAQAQRIHDGDAPGLGSFLKDTVRYGAPLYQRLLAGAYNDAQGRDNIDAHIPDYNMRDWTLPRAILAAAGLRTYQGDAERNEKLRDIEKNRIKKELEAAKEALERRPGRSEAALKADRSRFEKSQKRIEDGKPLRWDPWKSVQRGLFGGQ